MFGQLPVARHVKCSIEDIEEKHSGSLEPNWQHRIADVTRGSSVTELGLNLKIKHATLSNGSN